MNCIVRGAVLAFAIVGLVPASHGQPGELAHLATCPSAKKILDDHRKGLSIESELSRCAHFYQVARGHGDMDAESVLNLRGLPVALEPR